MNAIHPIRQALGFTQFDLASALGITQPSVCRYEKAAKGKSPAVPPPALAIRLVDLCATKGLQITLDHVYGRAPLPASAPETDNSSPA